VAELRIVFFPHGNQRPVPKNGTVEDDIPFQSGHVSDFPCHVFWQVFKNGCPYATSTWLYNSRSCLTNLAYPEGTTSPQFPRQNCVRHCTPNVIRCWDAKDFCW